MEAWARPGPAGRGGGGPDEGPGGVRGLPRAFTWTSGGPAPPRGLVGIFVVAVGGFRVGLRVRVESSWLLRLAYTLLD